jgi:2-succinyl-6-hydroxy-2,4-cyclohexadiene-1-carboxylate synthase
LTVTHVEIDAGDDLRLHAEQSGTGPPLVLLHGFTGSTETWAPLRRGFEAGNRVIAVDLPGHGLSSSPVDPERYSLPRFAGDLALVLDHFDIESTALLGYSMGGRAALHFALANQGRVSSLVLESASAGIADPTMRPERSESDEELATFIESRGLSAFVDRWEMLPLWESQRSLPDVERSVLRSQRMKNNPRGLANSLRGAGAARDPIDASQLERIDVRALLIAGALDTKYVGIARQLARTIPDARTAFVSDAGHAVHLEQPALFVDEVRRFLDGS